ncbi:DoxX family protein [[Mycobacterium] nativiensis]|uniref:DoxX family protein n=1 Tax=[Mycobacterium] nativiensis TaxID=2855503 RepID=A0ABU5Y1R5_9MYCO|nr:DoxX family protein [Mycolicibacter sp. MYC340]MEB3034189.1 DoxX family protein [Mycolicibacter sp. MYC340]
MNFLTARPTYALLAAFLAGDAVASAIPVPYVAANMDAMRVPPRIRPAVPVVKGVTALGLASVFRFPGVARVTTALLTLYFAGAVGIHLRVRNRVANIVPAVLLLGVFGTMTARGPHPAPGGVRAPGSAA